MKYDRIIIGAGAAGLFYAAMDTSKGKKIIIEKTDRPGQKLLMSGGGMCNITHSGSVKKFPDHYGAVGNKIRSCLYKHGNSALTDFLEKNGVPLFTRPDGKVFPESLKASDIRDLLVRLAKKNDYEFRRKTAVTGIEYAGPTEWAESVEASSSVQWTDSLECTNSEERKNQPKISVTIMSAQGSETLEAGTVVIAAGGASYPGTGSDGSMWQILDRDLGIDVTDTRPALAPIFVQDYPFSELSGISFDRVQVSSGKHSEEGAMILTHRGFSGPAILHLSKYVKVGDRLTVNYLPGYTPNEILAMLKSDHQGNKKSIPTYIAGKFDLPKAFTEKMLNFPKRTVASLGGKEMENVTHLITARTHLISGTGGYNEAMVTAGGIALEELDLKTMGIKKYPGLYAIGEVTDIDGDTGGYNLQFAYSSAAAAVNIV